MLDIIRCECMEEGNEIHDSRKLLEMLKGKVLISCVTLARLSYSTGDIKDFAAVTEPYTMGTNPIQ